MKESSALSLSIKPEVLPLRQRCEEDQGKEGSAPGSSKQEVDHCGLHQQWAGGKWG